MLHSSPPSSVPGSGLGSGMTTSLYRWGPVNGGFISGGGGGGFMYRGSNEKVNFMLVRPNLRKVLGTGSQTQAFMWDTLETNLSNSYVHGSVREMSNQSQRCEQSPHCIQSSIQQYQYRCSSSLQQRQCLRGDVA